VATFYTHIVVVAPIENIVPRATAPSGDTRNSTLRREEPKSKCKVTILCLLKSAGASRLELRTSELIKACYSDVVEAKQFLTSRDLIRQYHPRATNFRR
jgi:hypothetical protein